jgi:Ferritin-like
MSGEKNAPAGGRGRLAQVIATRGGLAAPEAPFVIEHREALIYMLCEAAELEHAIMCQYLFAAFSLKQAPEEGLGGTELDAVQRWRKQVSHVAAQEMLHLALVQNLLAAIGAAPHLTRPNLPAPTSHYPAGVQLALLPFGEQALRHFMFLERPEGMDLADADGLAAVGRAEPVLSGQDIVPRGQDFATVGHLYRSIEAGLARLAGKYGEDWLFVGPPRAQATEAHFGWPELVAVTDLASARRAIEEILEQGEGPRGHWRHAHFGQFVEILDGYQQLCQANPGFDPVRRVMAANVRPSERDADVPLIGGPLSARVTDLFNVGYEILLRMFERFFAHTEETDAQPQTLAGATIAIMLEVIKPLGDLITTLPVGDAHPGMTAGPSFELFYENDYVMPHREAAWALLAERLEEAARLCEQLQAGRGQHIAQQLEPVLAAMRDISQTLAAHLPKGSAHARLAAAPAQLKPADLDALTGRARDLAASVAARAPGRTVGELARVFEKAHAIVESVASGLACGPGEQVLIVPRLVDSVLRPLADTLAESPAARRDSPRLPRPCRTWPASWRRRARRRRAGTSCGTCRPGCPPASRRCGMGRTWRPACRG